nr:PREDICTED: uncharacterized protein DDB_G0271670-like [Bemisia tabaci]
MLLLLITTNFLFHMSLVDARSCFFPGEGEKKFYICTKNEYCCSFGCCLSPSFQFYQLWYYWLMVILMFLLCSGGGWWYRYWLHERYPSEFASSLHAHRAGRPCPRPYRPARITYHPARETIILHHVWKGPDDVLVGGATRVRSPPSYQQSDGARVITNGVPISSPYHQIYGPPPSYDSVVAGASASVHGDSTQTPHISDIPHLHNSVSRILSGLVASGSTVQFYEPPPSADAAGTTLYIPQSEFGCPSSSNTPATVSGFRCASGSNRSVTFPESSGSGCPSSSNSSATMPGTSGLGCPSSSNSSATMPGSSGLGCPSSSSSSATMPGSSGLGCPSSSSSSATMPGSSGLGCPSSSSSSGTMPEFGLVCPSSSNRSAKNHSASLPGSTIKCEVSNSISKSGSNCQNPDSFNLVVRSARDVASTSAPSTAGGSQNPSHSCCETKCHKKQTSPYKANRYLCNFNSFKRISSDHSEGSSPSSHSRSTAESSSHKPEDVSGPVTSQCDEQRELTIPTSLDSHSSTSYEDGIGTAETGLSYLSESQGPSKSGSNVRS